MNPQDFVSREELIAAGWTTLKIDAALDEADKFGPTGHWLNTTGKPYYDRDRVAVAAYWVGLNSQTPLDAQWTSWAQKSKPTSLPLLTFNFHRLAETAIKNASERFLSLRLSHPVLGRCIGAKDEESLFVQEVLKELVFKVSGVRLESQKALMNFLSERSVVAMRVLGAHRPGDIVVRPARRKSYVSKADGDKSIHRFIDAIALVHAGLVHDHDGKQIEVNHLLVHSPQFRFDIKCLLQPTRIHTESTPLENHHLLGQGELCDLPSRNESWCDFVRYGGDNRWELRTERVDLDGLSQFEPVTVVMSTTELVEWALQRDHEVEKNLKEGPKSLVEPDNDADHRNLGPVASRLYKIARDVCATVCVDRLDSWLAGTWPVSATGPKIRILEIKGVTTRGVWIRTYHTVLDIETNLGPAYLYPPDAGGFARLILKPSNVQSADVSVLVPESMLPRIQILMSAYDLSRNSQKQPEPQRNIEGIP